MVQNQSGLVFRLTVTLSSDWAYRGFRALIIENEELRLTILPEYGAKIFQFILKKTDRDLLYHNPRVEIRRPVYGVNVDDWWHGGIDECIPTGQRCTYRGDEYPPLGEVWSMPWDCEIEKDSEDEVAIHLSRNAVIAPLRVERWITLRANDSIVEMRHKITNVGYSNFEFLWGIHPGLAINPSSRIDIPSSKVIIDESAPNNRLGTNGSHYTWPYAKTQFGEQVDMRLVQAPESKTLDMQFATEFSEGWLALTDTYAKVGFGFAFPKDVFKCIWLWLVYGGWRGLYCAAIEAWTGYPGRLDLAVKNGTNAALEAGASLNCETRLVGYTGLSKVDRILPSGIVEGS
jgi:galactose mutarotase-like enzyme